MNRVNSIKIKTPKNSTLEFNLFNEDKDSTKPFYTVVTGHNGSFKSIILKEISEYAMMAEKELVDNENVKFSISSPEEFKVIAHSGATIDRYPIKKFKGKISPKINCYTYLGQKVGANIISRRQPLETIITEALSNDKYVRTSHSFFEKVFDQLSLKPVINLILMQKPNGNRLKGYNSLYHLVRTSTEIEEKQSRTTRFIDKDLASYLFNEFTESEFADLEYSDKILKLEFSEHGFENMSRQEMRIIKLGLLIDFYRISKAEVISKETHNAFPIFDLSTGEFNLITSILGLGFSAEKNSIVLIDEPEVSLHPQWQVDFITMIYEIFKEYNVSHIIISTHSPMIVSAVTGNSLTIDLSRDGGYIEEAKSLTGASTDEILMSHFGLATSRNFFVLEVVQKAVNLIESDQENSDEFKALIPSLNEIKVALSFNDPMRDVIDTVINYGK
ncbi:TPA: AAA family ATPase [Enterobacter bugandensis]|nr:AAA family ATPase [Enterobacter bugandensis]